MEKQLDAAAKKQIGKSIKKCLVENDLKRVNGGDQNLICNAKQLAARIGRTESVIYKLHSGEFSLNTLQKVESVLGRSFSASTDANDTSAELEGIEEQSDQGPIGNITKEHWIGAMPVRFGGYTKELLEPYLGEFIAVSRGISIPDNLLASKFNIYWDDYLGAARFSEQKRFTASDGKLHDYSQSGTVHFSLEIKNIHLLTARLGALRLITMTGIQRNPDPVMYGAVLTQVPEAGNYRPSKSTIHFRKMVETNRDIYGELMGVITPANELYPSLIRDLQDAESAIYTR